VRRGCSSVLTFTRIKWPRSSACDIATLYLWSGFWPSTSDFQGAEFSSLFHVGGLQVGKWVLWLVLWQ
jgi:hypothetical protein